MSISPLLVSRLLACLAVIGLLLGGAPRRDDSVYRGGGMGTACLSVCDDWPATLVAVPQPASDPTASLPLLKLADSVLPPTAAVLLASPRRALSPPQATTEASARLARSTLVGTVELRL